MRYRAHYLASLPAILATACSTSPKPEGRPVDRMWERPVASTPEPVTPAPNRNPGGSAAVASVPAAATDEVLAYINGTPVTRSFVANELIRTHGLSVLQQMIVLITARDRARQMNLTVTPADIKAAHDDALRRMSVPMGGTDELPLDRPTAERLLAEFLLAKNIARSEWDRRMEQQAYLRKIATAEVDKTPITEAMLKEQYGLDFGERVQIRHIQVSTLEAETRARRELLAGKDFELVARQVSENQLTAVRGGLLPPFTRNDPTVTPLVREAAFKLKVGEVSPAISADNWYQIIRVERRFPASDITFENADKEVLKTHLRDRLTRSRQTELEAELYRGARIDIRDRELSTQFHRAMPKAQ